MEPRVASERHAGRRCIGARGRIEPRVASERYVWLRCIGARGRIDPRVASERYRRLRSWSQPVSYQVLARKWRPQTFDAVVGQDGITRTLRNALASAGIGHAYLFPAPGRIGKPTAAPLL